MKWQLTAAAFWYHNCAAGVALTGVIALGSLTAGPYTGTLAVTSGGVTLSVPLAITLYVPTAGLRASPTGCPASPILRPSNSWSAAR